MHVNGITQLMRTTATGSLTSQVHLLESGSLTLVDGDGTPTVVNAGATILILTGMTCNERWFQNLIDAAELMLHGASSARIDGAPIITVFDVRRLEERKNVGDDIPF